MSSVDKTTQALAIAASLANSQIGMVYIRGISKEIGCGSPGKARSTSCTRKSAAFFVSVPVYGGGNGEPHGSQETLRVPLSSTSITRRRPTWKLFGGCSQGTTGAIHV